MNIIIAAASFKQPQWLKEIKLAIYRKENERYHQNTLAMPHKSPQVENFTRKQGR